MLLAESKILFLISKFYIINLLKKHYEICIFFQMKQFHVDDPSDLCSVRISGQELREVHVHVC